MGQLFVGVPSLVRPQVNPAQHGQRSQFAGHLIDTKDQAGMGVGPETKLLATVAAEITAKRVHAAGHFVVAHQERVKFLVPAVGRPRFPGSPVPVYFGLHQPAPLRVHPHEVRLIRLSLGVGVELLPSIPLVDQLALTVEMGRPAGCGEGFDHNESALAVGGDVGNLQEVLGMVKSRPAAIDLHCPYIYDNLIQFIGGRDQGIWQRTLKLPQYLESGQTGPLRHDAKRNVPFGTSWNQGSGLKSLTFAAWAGGLPEIQIATTIEIPYSQVGTTPQSAAAARRLGLDLAVAIKTYLETESSPGVGPSPAKLKR